MNENQNANQSSGLLNTLIGNDLSATVRVKLDNDQYIYLALAVIAGMLLGTLFGDILKKMLGTT